ncbi:MAG: glycosyltransferase family 4 protein [Alphaproteobacteria bacterium]
MKILYHHRTRSKDGQNVHIEELIAALRRRGHEIIVVAPPVMQEAAFGSDAGIVGLLKSYLPQAFYELLEFGYGVLAYRRLKAAVTRHRPDVLYERYNLFLLAGVRLARRHGLPFLLEVNSPLLQERQKSDGVALETLAAWTERTAWRAADHALPVTNCLADHLRAAGLEAVQIQVIPNGINLDRFDGDNDGAKVRGDLKLIGKTILGFTGFMRDWHGLERVVDVMADAPNRAELHFLVVGDGPARAALEAHAAARHIANQVTVTGIIGRDDVAGYVAAFDIALQPQVTEYASPLKLFEYMALGRAIVAPNQRNIREVLTDGRDSLLFEPSDNDAFTAAIRTLVADPGLRQSLGRGAMKTVHDRGFTWDDNAARVEDLFLALLESKGK